MSRSSVQGALTALSGFVARASNQIASIVVMLIATRYLNPSEFGVFALASISVTLIRTILYAGAFEYLMKTPQPEIYSTECLIVNLVLSAILSILLCGGALAAGRLGGAYGVAGLILMLAPSNLIAAVGSWRESLLLRSRRLKLYYGLTTLAEVLAMIVALALLMGGYKAIALIWQIYTRNIALLIFYSLTGKPIWSRHIRSDNLREVMGWSLTRYGSVLLNFGANYGADFFLGVFLSPSATGLFRASSRLVTAVADMFAQPTRLIAQTLFSARAAAGLSSTKIWPNVFVVSSAVGWSALAGLAAVAGQIVPIALGHQWRDAAPLVPILCLARASGLLDSVTMPLLVASNYQRSIFFVQCGTSALLILLLIGCARFGVMPATIAVAAAALTASIGLALLAFRRLPGAGRLFVANVPLTIFPASATIVGAMSMRFVDLPMPGGPTSQVGLSVVGGVAGWLFALLLVRRRAVHVIDSLQRSTR